MRIFELLLKMFCRHRFPQIFIVIEIDIVIAIEFAIAIAVFPARDSSEKPVKAATVKNKEQRSDRRKLLLWLYFLGGWLRTCNG